MLFLLIKGVRNNLSHFPVYVKPILRPKSTAKFLKKLDYLDIMDILD